MTKQRSDHIVLIRIDDTRPAELSKWTALVLITLIIALAITLIISIVSQAYTTAEDVAMTLMLVAIALLLLTIPGQIRLWREAARIEKDSVTIMKMISGTISEVRYGINEVVICLRDVFLHIKYPGGEADFPVTPKLIEKLENILGRKINSCTNSP